MSPYNLTCWMLHGINNPCDQWWSLMGFPKWWFRKANSKNVWTVYCVQNFLLTINTHWYENVSIHKGAKAHVKQRSWKFSAWRTPCLFLFPDFQRFFNGAWHFAYLIKSMKHLLLVGCAALLSPSKNNTHFTLVCVCGEIFQTLLI